MMSNSFITIDQKKSAYDYAQAKTLNNVLDTLKAIQSKNPDFTYFRGQSNGSWKITSFLQRKWIQNNLGKTFSSYQDLIRKLLDFAKKNHSSCLTKYDANMTDCGILSTLQHFGAPTPFVDWSSDFNVSLYMATSSSIDANESPIETENYISIYWLEVGRGPETPNNDLTDIGMALKEFAGNEAIEDSEIIKSVIDKFRNMTSWEQLYWFFSDKYFPLVNINNPRQELQKGGFFYSSEFDKTLDEIFDDNDLPKIHCLDISKALVPEIQEYVKNLNINEKTLGLNTCDSGKMLFEYFLEHYHHV